MPQEPKLSEEQIEKLVAAIERMERRRRILLGGYLAALTLLVLGQIGAFWIYGTAPPGSSYGWVFLIPFAIIGFVLWGFGRLAKRIR